MPLKQRNQTKPVNITHCSANFTWFGLLSQQHFYLVLSAGSLFNDISTNGLFSAKAILVEE